MLGQGPVVEGYSLIFTRDHVRSMLDIRKEQIEEYLEFSSRLVMSLRTFYSGVLITEHGRTPICQSRWNGQETHCYHAHQLVFPINLDLFKLVRPYAWHFDSYKCFEEAWKRSHSIGEYLYCQEDDGTCAVIQTRNRAFRQFFRWIIADAVGHPKRANWKIFRGDKLILGARQKLWRI